MRLEKLFPWTQLLLYEMLLKCFRYGHHFAHGRKGRGRRGSSCGCLTLLGHDEGYDLRQHKVKDSLNSYDRSGRCQHRVIRRNDVASHEGQAELIIS